MVTHTHSGDISWLYTGRCNFLIGIDRENDQHVNHGVVGRAIGHPSPTRNERDVVPEMDVKAESAG